MADWSVLDSETDEPTSEKLNNTPQTNHVVSFTLDSVFGNVDSKKVIELMQRISIQKTLELDCTSGYHEERKRKKRKRKNRESFHTAQDEVSETTSERISTHTASTSGCTMECVDNRRPSLSAFDYEDERAKFPALMGASTPLAPGKRKKPCLAKILNPKPPAFATIHAKLQQEKLHASTSNIDGNGNILYNGGTSPSPLLLTSDSLSASKQCTSNGFATASNHPFNFSFDDDDENELSFNSQDDNNISMKIRKIQNFLDQN